MSTDKKPDTSNINDYIRNALNPAQKFTVVQDGRSREFTTTTSDGHVFEGRDGMNDALHYFLSGAKPRNRRDDNEGGGDSMSTNDSLERRLDRLVEIYSAQGCSTCRHTSVRLVHLHDDHVDQSHPGFCPSCGEAADQTLIINLRTNDDGSDTR